MKKYIHKVQYHSNQTTKKLLHKASKGYFCINKMRPMAKYSIGGGLILIGSIFVPNPLLPGRLLLGLGISIFFPNMYHKLIGKYLHAKKLPDTQNLYSKEIQHTMLIYKRRSLKMLKAKRKRYRYKKMKI